jgi:hypothetical protein
MLNTIFPLVKTLEFFQGIPRNTGLMFNVVVARLRRLASTRCEMNRFPRRHFRRKGRAE